jgi:hypothetical protein
VEVVVLVVVVIVVVVAVVVVVVIAVDVVVIERLWCCGLMRHRHMVSKTSDASERQSDASENGTGRLASREEWKVLE